MLAVYYGSRFKKHIRGIRHTAKRLSVRISPSIAEPQCIFPVGYLADIYYLHGVYLTVLSLCHGLC
jgi:hypothetical protein